jgi:hypothetical protein
MATPARIRSVYPDVALFPNAEAYVFVACEADGRIVVARDVRGARDEQPYPDAKAANTRFAELAAELKAAYEAGTYSADMATDAPRAKLSLTHVEVRPIVSGGVRLLADDDLRGPVALNMGQADARWLLASLLDLKNSGALGEYEAE